MTRPDAATILRGKHRGETAWIIGSGPSLGNLAARHIGQGPVIAMNSSIAVVQELGLTNPIYSLQKDGCSLREIPGHECGEYMVYPRPEITLVLMAEGFSELCLSEHTNRVWLDFVTEYGLHPPSMVIGIAIALALRTMGCSRLMFVCCDSLLGDEPERLARYDHRARKIVPEPSCANYSAVRQIVLAEADSAPYYIITPEAL